MRIKRLSCRSYRGLGPGFELTFDNRVTVIAGVNGSGKSSVLDCLAVLLSRFPASLRGPKMTAGGRNFQVGDIAGQDVLTTNTVVVDFDGTDFGGTDVNGTGVEWSLRRARVPSKWDALGTKLSELRAVAATFRDRLADGASEFALPLAVYYPVNRSVLDIPLRIRKRHVFDQLTAYDDALSRSPTNFRRFFEWFREREDLENERRRDDFQYRDRQLKAVRTAVAELMPGFEGLRVRRKPLRMTVQKHGIELLVGQLSDGEKCTLALAGDLARRLAQANPSSEVPNSGRAVVLIDEVELHAHPGWQQRMLTALLRTFPGTQFIVTTHSALVLSGVKAEQIWLLERSSGFVVARHPEDAFGLDANRVLLEVMGVDERDPALKRRFDDMFESIHEGRFDLAESCLGSIRAEIGDDPALARAAALIRRKRVLGR